MRLLTADEGRAGAAVPAIEAMFEDALAAIRRAGLRPGHDVALAIDVAASHLRPRPLSLGRAQARRRGDDRADRALGRRLRPVSVEDGLASDWAHWPALLERLGERAQIVGDDLLCTNRIGSLAQPRCARPTAAAEGQPDRHAQRGARGQPGWRAASAGA